MLLALSSGNAFGRECLVAGTVVDRNLRPVANAEVVAYTPPTTWEDLIILNNADDRGSFEIELPCKSLNTHLFVAPPRDRKNNFYPINVPYWINDKSYQSILPKKLPPVKNGVYNIGQIVAPVYRKVEISFVNEDGSPILPAEPGVEFWLRIKTAGGDLITSGSMSIDNRKNAKSPEKSALTMTLPEGKWIIEINFNWGKGQFFYPDKIVEPENVQTGEPQKITLKMSKKKTRLKP